MLDLHKECMLLFVLYIMQADWLTKSKTIIKVWRDCNVDTS